jgi:hypothetical protein
MSQVFETLYDTVKKQQEYSKILELAKQKLQNDRKNAKMSSTMKKNVKTLPTKPKRRTRQRLNPDSTPVLVSAVALVFVLMASSFVVSFSGIYTVSAWTGLPEFLQWLPALFIDAAIIAYTISLIVFKARGESTFRTMLGLLGFASISVVANVMHTLDFWNGQVTDFRGWIGVMITASAPIAVLLASEEITRLAFAKPKKKKKIN